MGELLSQLWSPQMQAAFTIVVILLVVLYVLSIIWVVRDAYLRGATWWVWGIVSLVPIAGVIAYCLLRPPLLQIDKDEQELEVALKKRELMRYGECALCGYPVEIDYVICPNCHTQLKNLCGNCGHALDPAWTICPYCATPVGMVPEAPQQTAASARASRSASSRNGSHRSGSAGAASKRSSSSGSASNNVGASSTAAAASHTSSGAASGSAGIGAAANADDTSKDTASAGRHSNSPRSRNAKKNGKK